MSVGAGPESLLARVLTYRWELVAAIAGAAASVALLPFPAAGIAAALALLAVFVAAVDIDRLIIPDIANAVIAVLGLALVLIEAWPGERWLAIGDALLRALITGGALLLLRFVYAKRTGVMGLGLGDVKLMAAGAIILTWASLPYALVLAAVAAILVVVWRGIRQGAWLDRETEIPFGAFLAPAIWAAFLLEQLYLL